MRTTRVLTAPCSPHTRLVTVLLICSDIERLEPSKIALQTAGFHSVTARSVDDGWTKLNFFDISAVVIDHEFADDPRAQELGQHYLTLRLEADALPEQVAVELVEPFEKGSELVQWSWSLSEQRSLLAVSWACADSANR